MPQENTRKGVTENSSDLLSSTDSFTNPDWKTTANRWPILFLNQLLATWERASDEKPTLPIDEIKPWARQIRFREQWYSLFEWDKKKKKKKKKDTIWDRVLEMN